VPSRRKPKELLKLKVLGNIIVALFQVLATTPDDPAERAEHELGPVRSAQPAKATFVLACQRRRPAVGCVRAAAGGRSAAPR